MNQVLTEEIVKHIFANLGIIPSYFVNSDVTKSLMDKDFVLSNKITFEVDGEEVSNNIWGCQLSAGEQEIKVLLANCSQDLDIPEFALLVQLKNAPTYGVYLVHSEDHYSEVLIAYSVKDNEWIQCNTFLQATFLAGMEQIKELGLNWSKCQNYQNQYKLLLSFIQFHQNYEEEYEGQEN